MTTTAAGRTAWALLTLALLAAVLFMGLPGTGHGSGCAMPGADAPSTAATTPATTSTGTPSSTPGPAPVPSPATPSCVVAASCCLAVLAAVTGLALTRPRPVGPATASPPAGRAGDGPVLVVPRPPPLSALCVLRL